jgi:hypothetical protein
MAGAIAGTAVLHLAGRSDRLKVVTLTVNNICNLQCSHCYLQYDAQNTFVDERITNILCESEFSHLAIVGKEPLVNQNTADQCRDLILKSVAQGKTVSLITNGHGLRYLTPETLSLLAWIDVSFDGGPQTYTAYRHAPYERLKQNVQWLKDCGYDRINAMFALSACNLVFVDDMMTIEREMQFERLVFSPYVVTSNYGVNAVSPVSLEQFCLALADSQAFMLSSKALALLDARAFSGVNMGMIRNQVRKLGLSKKTFLVENDPLNLGILRVTYDGLVLTPYESLDTKNYRSVGRPLLGAKHLKQIYHDLCLTASE